MQGWKRLGGNEMEQEEEEEEEEEEEGNAQPTWDNRGKGVNFSKTKPNLRSKYTFIKF